LELLLSVFSASIQALQNMRTGCARPLENLSPCGFGKVSAELDAQVYRRMGFLNIRIS
jgi:hypothetical protein